MKHAFSRPLTLQRKDAGITGMQHKEFGFKAETVSEDGTFTGYGSVFGNVDSYGEIVAPGAFKKSLALIKASGDPVPALWQHRSGEPIGGYTELSEDARGLKVAGFLVLEDPTAKRAHLYMQKRIVKGLSIGYYVRDSSYDEKTGIRTLKELDLVEISIVTFPANAEAQVESVKSVSDSNVKKAVAWLKKAIKLHEGHMNGTVSTSADSQKEMMMQMEKALSFLDETMAPMKSGSFYMPSLPEFEDFLCEAGFSKTQAKAVAGHGLRKLLDRCEADGKTSDTLALLKGFAPQTAQ